MDIDKIKSQAAAVQKYLLLIEKTIYDDYKTQSGIPLIEKRKAEADFGMKNDAIRRFISELITNKDYATFEHLRTLCKSAEDDRKIGGMSLIDYHYNIDAFPQFVEFTHSFEAYELLFLETGIKKIVMVNILRFNI